jgi:starch synthase (maltosyl-transferring)
MCASELKTESMPEETAGERQGRVAIESVAPELDCGRFAIKRIAGESVVVEADIFTDGHDELSAVLMFRREDDPGWTELPMAAMAEDRWRAEFPAREVGRYRYTVEGWVDRFKSWRRDLNKKARAGQEVATELLVGAEMAEAAAGRASGADAERLRAWAGRLGDANLLPAARVQDALGEELRALMSAHADRGGATRYGRELTVVVDREKARFSSWYEMFPRSAAQRPGVHGSLRDVIGRLPYVAEMGFDVLYLPPIHPIGTSYRKGANNSPTALPGEPGSPWAIGSGDGGHTAVHPELGTMDDFRELVAEAERQGIEIALDLALQTSPDHPFVREHPEWFRWRPDGTIQYAENPPKRYQDIFPLNFETPRWLDLWKELRDVVLYWVGEGVRIFRVDNPHTKPFAFWEWLITEVKRDRPDVIFLAEAFTRPRVMYRLAKLGFSQSYSYFAWRNTKLELTQYLTELTQTDVREFFRPSLWPNTPDILTEALQFGGRPAFTARLVLAATLGASYGIYGPPFELQEGAAKEPGSEEYLNSEKYEIRYWDRSNPNSLKDFISRVNRIRRENPALQSDSGLRFHTIDNEDLLCYSKSTEDLSNVILVVVNLDYRWPQSGWVELPLKELGLDAQHPYQVHDLVTGARFLWHGARNFVELNPQVVSAHIFRVTRRVRSEHQFEYYG